MRSILFTVERKGSGSRMYLEQGRRSRAGVLHTPHGGINTPAFVAVATKADVKGIDAAQFEALGIQTVIANAYHLYLSGLEAVEKAGGVGEFMGWPGPTMTDSGGFQVFSLGEGFGLNISKFGNVDRLDSESGLGKKFPAIYDEELATSHGKLAIVDDEGVSFTSHLDGSLHRFTPERSVELQHRLGADIFFAFDQCTAPTESYEFQKEAMERTHRWAKRSLQAHRQMSTKDSPSYNKGLSFVPAIYGIGQGGQFDDLRRESAQVIGEMGFDGFGLGGSFSKKYGENSLQSALDMLQQLPPEMPVHGLGVGEPEDILLATSYGVDTFDCVTPTRNGRTGGIYTHQGKIQVPNAEYREDFSPLDSGCQCPICVCDNNGKPRHTRAYLHHLFRTHEMLGPILASMHNIFFLTNLCSQIREAILDGKFEEFGDAFLTQYKMR